MKSRHVSSSGHRRKNFLRWQDLLSLAGIITGLLILLYPTYADLWNQSHSVRVIAAYETAVRESNADRRKEEYRKAMSYNRRLMEKEDRFHPNAGEQTEYERLLDITGTGIMSYLVIPKLSLTLPVYHGTEREVLQRAAGHLPGSSLPVGGSSSHCVICGHRGIASAKLFTDLDRLRVGDEFELDTIGIRLFYEIDSIRIVLPEEVKAIEIEAGSDQVTLVTCTPYGINSHRLLVRGRRVRRKKQCFSHMRAKHDRM